MEDNPQGEVNAGGECDDTEQNRAFSAGKNGFDLSDDGLGLALGEDSWNFDAKHVGAINRWLFWDDTRWQYDETSEGRSRVRVFLRGRAAALEAWAQAEAKRLSGAEARRVKDWAKWQAEILRSITKMDAVRRTAASNDPSRARRDDFDQDLMLLGTPGGTVDLRTGALRRARREDMITKQTAVPPVDLWHRQDDGGPVR